MKDLPVALVVDDEFTNIVLIETILNDFKVEKAYSVDTAIKILKNKKIDIIISDYNMPNKNGLNFLNWVNENEVNIPFVFVSAIKDTDHIKKLIQKGADDYITKPLSIRPFYNKIKNILSLRKQRKQNIT